MKNDVFKNTLYDKLVLKVDDIDTTGFVLKTTYDTYKSAVEKKIKLVGDEIVKHGGLATKKRICRTVGPSLAASLESLAHRRNVASLSLLYRYYFGRCSSEVAQLVPLPYS